MKLSNATLIQLALICIIVCGYFLIDFNKLLQQLQGQKEFVTHNKPCDLHKEPCTIFINDKESYTLEIFPKPIPIMKKITLKVTSTHKNISDLNLNIYATNMFMGEMQLKLHKQPDGSYKTYGTLPTCPIGNMQWNADITTSSFTHKKGARFQFQTDF